MSDEYEPFGGIAPALRAFCAFPMDPRMKAMLKDAADEIERLRGLLTRACNLLPLIEREVGSELADEVSSIMDGERGVADQPAPVMERPWQEIVQHATRYLFLRDKVSGLDNDGDPDNHVRLWIGDAIHQGQTLDELVDRLMPRATDPTPAAHDPERITLPRCRCGGFPRPSLMGQMVCSVCGSTVTALPTTARQEP